MPRSRDRSLLWKMQRRLGRRLRALLALLPHRASPEHVELREVKTRLEYYLRAVYGRPITIDAVATEESRGAKQRAMGRVLRRVRLDVASDSGDDVIRLPSRLVATAERTTPFERYRCLAVQHAERLTRATARHASALASPLEQDLFQLAEAVGVDRRIAITQPGLAPAMEDGRRTAMRARDSRRGATELERRVEQLAARTLTAPISAPDAVVPSHERAEQSVDWARRTAAELAGGAPAAAVRGYRRIAPLGLWRTAILGSVRPGGGAAAGLTGVEPPATDAKPARPKRKRRLASAGRPEEVVAVEDPTREDGQQGASSSVGARPVENAPAAEEGAGVAAASSSADRDDPDASASPERGGSHRPSDPPSGEAYRYLEWDLYAKSYHLEGSIVRVRAPTAAASGWADAAAREHAVLIRRVRDRFAQLRAHRLRLRRQPNGDEIDLDAVVTAFADQAAGRTPDDRLYATVHATRREMAILLLIDVSASTGARIDADNRVIDIERLSALVAAEAFDALGDAWSISAFSSDGRADVRVAVIKRFDERNTPLTGMRLAALEPANATRLGAALRHATAELALRPEASRLLLVLSDGRPNDRDGYIDEDYGVEDSRRAVAEARMAGVTPYCITIDPEEPQEYIGHIFGEKGYRALAETSQLPMVLVQAVQGLLRR
jgi:nitric oxide reductase NorD protein